MWTYGFENKACQDVDHNMILKYLSMNGYTDEVLTNILNDDNFEILHKCEFNCTIRNIVCENKIPMFDILVYIEKNFVDGRKVWCSILDNRNKETLKKEVCKDYHIKQQECSLADMFE